MSSFCSLSGYTVVDTLPGLLRDRQNERIFNYFTTGCNRDGLAVRALAKWLEDSPCEHKLVILLSDVKPNDVIQISQSGRFVDYAGDNGIQNTAMEIRALTYRGISVMCVFTETTTICPPPTRSTVGISPASALWTSSPIRWAP